MPSPHNQSRDEAHAAIAEAFRLIGQSNEVSEKPALFDKSTAQEQPSNLLEVRSFDSTIPSAHRRHFSRVLGAILVLASIGFAALAWRSSHGQDPPEIIATSSLPVRKHETLTAPAEIHSETAAKMSVTSPDALDKATPQPSPLALAPAIAPPELEQQVQAMARELENVERGINQLETAQAQIVRGNAELADRLKVMQEVTLHTAELMKNLEAAERQMALDNNKLAEQFKESQDRLANMADLIRGGQEQLTRRIVSEQKRRPATPATAPLANVIPARKPTTSPPAAVARAQPQGPRANQ
jgi:hypothetical protein